MKRKIKVWNKIRLYEASVVGIPAYPDAHASVESFSLVKALSHASLTGFVGENEDMSDKLNLMEEKETMEEKSQEVESAKSAEVVVEKTETKVETDMSEVIAKAIKDGIKEAMDELKTDRGVVEKQIPVKKSLGELAIEQGLFVRK